MKKIYFIFVAALLAVGFVSAGLCKSSSGYYEECGSSSVSYSYDYYSYSDYSSSDYYPSVYEEGYARGFYQGYDIGFSEGYDYGYYSADRGYPRYYNYEYERDRLAPDYYFYFDTLF
ncbi:MAG: hypothetical protein RL557_145 [archaeon]